jgi:hypothetical protein
MYGCRYRRQTKLGLRIAAFTVVASILAVSRWHDRPSGSPDGGVRLWRDSGRGRDTGLGCERIDPRLEIADPTELRPTKVDVR